MQYRQGDVFIEQISSIPQDVKKQENKEKILARGEATGHHHSIEITNATESFVDSAGLLYLNLQENTTLIHQEHAPIEIPKGFYRVIIQREYGPDEIRNVLD